MITYIKLEKGTCIYLTDGKHVGDHGFVEHIEGNTITYKTTTGKITTTSRTYALALGKPASITLP